MGYKDDPEYQEILKKIQANAKRPDPFADPADGLSPVQQRELGVFPTPRHDEGPIGHNGAVIKDPGRSQDQGTRPEQPKRRVGWNYSSDGKKRLPVNTPGDVALAIRLDIGS